MKQINAVKKFLLIALLGVSGSAIGQNWHPYTFDSSGRGISNWFANFVGERLEVTTPTVIAGDKLYTTANNGSGVTGEWGGTVTSPLVNVRVFMDTTSDSFGHEGATALSAADIATITSTTPHMIVAVWRGPIGTGAVDFACKAENAELAGASAVVIMNEYPGQGPIGMGEGTTCTPTTIPVFMIGNADGVALSAQYRSGVPVRMTITPWGQNYQNDLGFIPGGYSIWHDFAIPSYMLASENPLPYNGIDGAFVANYGNHDATNVKVKAGLTFTPNSGSAGATHYDSISLASFPHADSIWAMFAPAEYNLPLVTTPGRFDLNYVISSDSPEQYTFDNSLTYSYYASDSIFSKGRYDFVNQHVITTQYYQAGGTAGTYMWGVPYYITQGGDAFKDIKFSIASTTAGSLPGQAQNFYIFKWVDGSAGAGTLDSAIEGGELALVGIAVKTFDGSLDSSEGYFTTDLITGDTLNPAVTVPVQIDSNSWYYIAADVSPISATNNMFLGCDGTLDMYPRAFGRKHFHNVTELYNTSIPVNYPAVYPYEFNSITFSGFSGPAVIDSVIYSEQIGLIPNLALEVTKYIPNRVSVKNTAVGQGSFEVFPNPASDYVNATISLTATAKVVSYKVIDMHTRVIARETHNNVQNDKFTFNTSNLASGNYFMVVDVDGKPMFKKFTVIR